MATGSSTIRELANSVGFKGPANHKIAEPSTVRTLPVIDNSVPSRKNVNTSVDCYVSGQYVQRSGKTIEVTQRYTIFVSYAADTQVETMAELRSRIVSDFESRYGTTFNITNIFVPAIPVPIDEPKSAGAAPLEMYKGTTMFKAMAKYEKLRFDLSGERLKASTNIDLIKRRYKGN